MARDFSQASSAFLASLDEEIVRLQTMRQQVADALGAETVGVTRKAGPGRPKTRNMSEEGRRKIAAAQKARWAKQKNVAKSAAKKSAGKDPAKKTPVKNAPKKALLKKIAAKAAIEHA